MTASNPDFFNDFKLGHAPKILWIGTASCLFIHLISCHFIMASMDAIYPPKLTVD